MHCDTTSWTWWTQHDKYEHWTMLMKTTVKIIQWNIGRTHRRGVWIPYRIHLWHSKWHKYVTQLCNCDTIVTWHTYQMAVRSSSAYCQLKMMTLINNRHCSNQSDSYQVYCVNETKESNSLQVRSCERAKAMKRVLS